MQETQEMWVPTLGQEDPLEEGMAAHSSVENPWTEELSMATGHRVGKESDMTKVT